VCARARRQVLGATIVTLAAGVVTGLAAAAGAGPFSGLPGHATTTNAAAGPIVTTAPQPVRADKLFPPPSAATPRDEVVYVQDPTLPPVYVVVPPAATSQAPASESTEPPATSPPTQASTAPPTAPPTIRPTSPPSASPPPCDNCGPDPSASPDPGGDT
jgi:hypothetical protein